MRFSTDFSTPYLQHLNTEPTDPCSFASQRKSSIMFYILEILIRTSDSRNFNPEAGVISQIFRV